VVLHLGDEHLVALADGERTLRAYSRPVSLARFDRIGWMTTEEELWPVVEHLAVIGHTPLMPAAAARRLARVDRRSYQAGLHGAPPHDHVWRASLA